MKMKDQLLIYNNNLRSVSIIGKFFTDNMFFHWTSNLLNTCLFRLCLYPVSMGSFPTVCIIFRPEFQNLLLQTWQAIPLLHLWTIFPQDIVVYCSGSCSPAYFCRFFNKCSWQCQHSIGVQYIPLVATFSYTLITRQHHCCELLACQFLCWSVFIPCNYLAASTCQLDWTERVHVFLLIDVSLILLSPRY